MKGVERLMRAPLAVVLVILAVTVFFAIQIPQVQLDNDVLAFIPEDHPDKLAFEKMDDLYDADLTIAVALRDPYGSVFSPGTINTIIEVTRSLEEIPLVSSVDSIYTIDYIEGTEEGMRAGPLLEDFDGSPRQIDELRRRLRSWEVYEGGLVSEDHRSTQILVSVTTGVSADDRERIYEEIESVVRPYENQGYQVYVAGEPAITVLLSTNMRADIATLIPIVIVVVLLSLSIFFRRLGGVLLPMITVLLSTIWTIGLMALLGIELSIVATVIPVLMIAVGSAYGIHIVNHYYDAVERVPVREAVHETLRAVGGPVLTAGLTTIVGFGALMTSQVGPMREFGVFTAVGVAVALIVALTLIPALLLLRARWGRSRSAPQRASGGGDPITVRAARDDGMLLSMYRFFGQRKRRILIFAILVAALAGWGASRLVVDNELIAYFKRNTDIRVADEFLRDQFLGTRSFNINVIGEAPGDLTNPAILAAMEELARYLEDTYEEIPRVLSYTEFIKRMNQVMNIGVPSPYSDVGVAETLPAEPEGTDPDVGFDHEGNDTFTGGFGGDGGFGSDTGFGGDAGGFSSDGDGFDVEGLFGAGFGTTGEESAMMTRDEADGPTSVPVASVPADPLAAARILNEAYALAGSDDVDSAELVRLVNRRLNFDGAAYYEIPYDPERYPVETREELSNLITQYLLLYSGELDNWADDALEPMQARMSVQLLTTGNRFTEEIVPEIHRFVADRFPPGYRVEIAGVAIVEQALTRLITNAQILSIVVSLSLVFLIVAIQFRSLVAGVFGIVPLGLTVLVNFGVMGFAGIKLDISTAMVASIAIGIGIDYTIHFLSSYRDHRRETDDLEEVELRVLAGTGKAITFNAVSVAAGFAVLVLSTFNPLMYMGILIALTMLTSSVASMTVLPVLLDLFRPRFMERYAKEET